MKPWEPRPIRFLGLREHGDWKLKTYSVLYGEAPFDPARFEPGIALALGALPPADAADGRPGLGFLIAHQGLTGDYAVVAWWDHENELPIRVWVRKGEEPWRPARDGESVCVWDLEVVTAEREAWIATMLSPDGPSPDAYLERTESRFRPHPREARAGGRGWDAGPREPRGADHRRPPSPRRR